MFLKTSNYLKTCPTRFPGAQRSSFHPKLPQGLLKVNRYSSMLFSLCRVQFSSVQLLSRVQLFATPWTIAGQAPVNYKLALTKSIAKDWTTKAFAICLCRDWTPCCCSCWPSTIPEGVQGGVRHSVLLGIWWDRSLDSWMFLGTDFMISILASPHI